MRAKLDIPKETFVCLTIFDFRSSYHRKNPLAVVSAYRKAIGNSKGCLLIVKSNGGDYHRDEYQEFTNAIRGIPNLVHLEHSMSREEVMSLINACDVYISPSF